MLSKEKVVCRSHIIVHVGLKTLFGQIRIETYKFDFFENAEVNRDLVISNDQTLWIVVVTMLSPPGMLLHLLNSDSLVRIHSQNFTDKVLQFN